jgi:hypothetical protein
VVITNVRLGGTEHNSKEVKLFIKGPHLNTAERFFIHKEAASGSHLNDEHTISHNRIFDTILRDFSAGPP